MSTQSTDRDPPAGMHEDAKDQLPLGLGDDLPERPQLVSGHRGEPEESVATVDDASGHLFDAPEGRGEAPVSLPLGARLRNAREARGMSLDQAARALRIPSARLADIEHGRLEAIGPAVYLRGYLRSYARLVGLPDVVVHAALDGPASAPPALVATRTISRSHYFTSRYGSLLVYGVLTAVFVVPLLWAARQGALLPESRAPLAKLDAGSAEFAAVPLQTAPSPPADVATPDAAAPQAGATAVPPVTLAPPPAEPLGPVMATMAPMPSKPGAGDSTAPARELTLELTEPSWIELIAVDGTRLEYALLPAGSRRTYELQSPANLRIGNTRGARLTLDGAPIALARHTRSNVARVPIPARDPDGR